MSHIKPIVILLSFVTVLSYWMFQVYSNSRANEDELKNKLIQIDTKITQLKSELTFVSKSKYNQEVNLPRKIYYFDVKS